ncbi:hypothetical protein OIU79_003104 [Salix purpurea]|uniref:Uncharacterized protein n=1 Tax=Salix purpurea TaxID=77065 RepID=A0A9Q0ZEY2_SALPP|nr:hypothetical protein OIU79_003104 [Salix purpurea]
MAGIDTVKKQPLAWVSWPPVAERRFSGSDQVLISSSLLGTTNDPSEQKRYKYLHKGFGDAQHCPRHVAITMDGFSHSQMSLENGSP